MSKRRGDFIDKDDLHLYHQKTRRKFQEKMDEGRKNLAEIQNSDVDDDKSAPEEDRNGLNNVPDSYGACSSEGFGVRKVLNEDQRDLNCQVDSPAKIFCPKTKETSRYRVFPKSPMPDPSPTCSSSDDHDRRKRSPSPDVTERFNFPITPQSCDGYEKISNSFCSKTVGESNFQAAFPSATRNNSTNDFSTDHSDVEEFEEVMGGFSQEFEELLSIILFPSSNMSVEDVLNMTQAIYLRYKIPIQAKLAILELIKVLAGPEYTNLNLSEYYVSKFNKPIEDNKTFTFYCTECYKKISKPLLRKEFTKKDSRKCEDCEIVFQLSTQNNNFYINMNIEYQLRNLFKNELIFESLLKSISKIKERQNTPREITDVHDGEIYKNKPLTDKMKENEIVLTANVNCDGGSMYNTTLASLWPLMLLINELPQKLRIKLVLLAAALYTLREPNHHLMNSFMGSFLQQTEKLMKEGMIFFHKARRKTYRIFVIPLFFVLDTVARPIVQARKQFNAHYGCSWCYAFGEKIGSMRYMKKHNAPNRTQEEYLKDLERRKKVPKDKKGEKVHRGVRGESIVAKMLPYLDNIWCYPPEYMHGVLLGVSKQFWKFISESSTRFRLSPQDLEEIDRRLTSLKPAKSMYRRPCELKKKSKWKAADWLYWLIFYSIPCYRNILDKRVFNSYVKFVNSIRLLLSSKIDDSTLDRVEIDLQKFVEDCEGFFGPTFMTFNVHSLLHLVESVRRSGPLWASSAFAFESEMGQYKEFVTGTTSVLQQITGHVLELNEFTSRVLSNPSEGESYRFCKSTMSSEHYVTNYHKTKEGATVPYCSSELNQNKYNRCIYKNAVFHSTLYTRPQLTDDTYVELSDGQFAQVIFFYLENEECYAHVQVIDVSRINVNGAVIPHIFLVRGVEIGTKNVPITMIQKKMIHLDVFGDLEYICFPLEVFDAQ